MKTFLDKILYSKLTKNERELQGSLLVILGFMTPAIVLLTLYILAYLTPIKFESFLVLILGVGITYVGCSLYGLYLYFKYKKLIQNEQPTASENCQT